MSDSKKSGKGKNIVIAILIIVLLTSPIFIIYGIVSTAENFIKGIVGVVVNAGQATLDWFKHIFGISRIIDGMYIYPLEGNSVTQLKQQLEAQGIRTDEAGLTEVMLRKMILAQAVTSFTRDTLCVAPVEIDEILQDTGYTELDEYLKTLDKKNSKDEWPIDKYNYDLYYVTDKFFYFEDEDDMMGKGTDKYYLGLIGSIEIKSNTGTELTYVSRTEFDKAKDNFNALTDEEKAKDDKRERIDLLHKYTINSNGDMVVHKIVKNTDTYKYTFTNNNSNTRIEKSGDSNSTYEVLEVPLDIQGSIDTSKYTLSIELLINLLNMSASPEFLDEFIDYALEESKISITAYSVYDEETSYQKNTYKIKDPFIYELYDIVNVGDIGSDNMQTYKSLIYERTYEGNYFNGSIVDIPGFESIDYDTKDLGLALSRAEGHTGYDRDNEEFLGAVLKAAGVSERKTDEELNKLTAEEKAKYEKEYENEQISKIGDWVDSWYEDYNQWTRPRIKKNFIDFIISGGVVRNANPIKSYLLAAYDPSGTSLGDAIGEEITINMRAETSWRFYISSMSTWYGKITYDNPAVSVEYYIDAIDATQEEYNNFSESSLTKYKLSDGEESKTKIYIYQGRATEVGITNKDANVTVIDSSDIFDNILKEDIRRR